MFDSDAAVDVPAAAYFAAADFISFAGDARFSASLPDGSTFSSAPPEAFGFLGGQANVAVTGTASIATAWGKSLPVAGILLPIGKMFIIGYGIAIIIGHFYLKRRIRRETDSD